MSKTESLTKQVARYYDQIDGHYDDLYAGTVCLAEDKIVMSFVSPHLLNNSSVLDIGCGTGLVPSYLNGNPYKGVDVSSTELQTAQEKLPHHADDFMVADMHNLPFGIESFDVVVSTYGPVSYSNDIESLKQEVLRPLRKGGEFILMPYTKRTGMGVGLGGFTTAIGGEVSRIYYKEEEIRKIFSKTEGANVIGINYLTNFIIEKLEGKDYVPTIDESFLHEQLIYLMNRMGEGHIEFPENINFHDLANLWQQFRRNRQNVDLMTEILQEEIKIFTGILPAHFARHMVVTGEKK